MVLQDGKRMAKKQKAAFTLISIYIFLDIENMLPLFNRLEETLFQPVPGAGTAPSAHPKPPLGSLHCSFSQPTRSSEAPAQRRSPG